MSNVKVSGLAELQAVLDTLPARIEQNIMRGALRSGANVFKEEAKRLCPQRTGDLMDSIRVSVRARRGRVTASIKAGNAKAWYAHLVEYGTARHWIKPKDRKSLFLSDVYAESINHPGAQKKPFMRPALDGKADAAVNQMAEYVRTRIPKELDNLHIKK